ncbi:MAG: alpha/beta hydrolase [Chitinophagales bacterium]
MKLEVHIFEPQEHTQNCTLLFLHGMAHAAWCFEWEFVPFFNQKGFRCITMSLRGHGGSEGRENLRWWRIRDYLTDLKSVLETIPHPVVLIAHSMGGFVAQKLLLEKYNIQGMVLLSAIPATGMWRGSLKTARHFPLKFIKGNLTLSTAPFSETEFAVRTLCFSESINSNRLKQTKERLQPESYMAYLDMLFLDLHHPSPSQTPTLFLHAKNDFLLGAAAIEKTAKGFGGEFISIPNLAHDMMIDTDWKIAADCILTWIAHQKRIT